MPSPFPGMDPYLEDPAYWREYHGDGYDAYRVKRDAVLQQHVNLVEIDLLLDGRRMEPASLLPPGDYYVFVGRADRPRERLAYAWSLRDRLPPVQVALRSPDPDVGLDLSAVFAAAYQSGRYARRLRYDVPTPAPLADEDRAWAEQVVRSARNASEAEKPS